MNTEKKILIQNEKTKMIRIVKINIDKSYILLKKNEIYIGEIK